MNIPSNDATPSTGGAGTCPDTGQLAALLGDDARQPPSAMAVHIEGCPACQRRLGELAGHGDWLEPLASGDAVTRSAVRAARQDEPALCALIDELRRRPHAASAGSENDPELAFLAPTDLPGYIGQLGPYQVIEVVGRGGMGIVLKAHDPSLARIVAIKVMAPVLAASASARKRFVREARAAAAISHENVVTIHAVDEAHGLPYIVMQFVAGRSLDARIAEAGGPLPVEEILRIAAQAASGLAAAHAQGLVHRDVKPANIMLEDGGSGRAKLTDFGLAHAADDASVTMTGQVSGTPSFMAPEQARGERVDARADLFSLGCVLYAACAGRPAFAAPTPLAALRAVCDDDPPPLAEVNPDVPPWLAEVVHGLLRKDPNLRPASAREVADVLEQHLGGSRSHDTIAGGRAPASGGHVRAGETSRAGRRFRRTLLLAGAGAVVLGVGLLVVAEMRGVTRVTPWFAGTPGRPADTSPAPLAPAAAPGETAGGAFAVVGASAGQSLRTFATLADAVTEAAAGDTIELRHNERTPTPRVDVGRKALRIRAGDGFRPTIAQAADGQAILTSGAALVLEGVTFEGTASDDAAPPRGDDPGECLVVATGGPLYVANCRFVARGSVEGRFGCLRVSASPACEVRNSELHALLAMGVQWMAVPAEGGTLRLENVVQSGRLGLLVGKQSPGKAELAIDSGSYLVQSFVGLVPGDPPPPGLSVRVERSVVMTTGIRQDISPIRRDDPFKNVAWTDSQVIYDVVRRGTTPGGPAAPAGPELPGDGSLRTAVRGQVRFAGEFRRMQGLEYVPDPADFRLEAVRLPGGRMATRPILTNTGANLSLIGPGPAYEAFRQSSAYATWRVQSEDALRQAR